MCLSRADQCLLKSPRSLPDYSINAPGGSDYGRVVIQIAVRGSKVPIIIAQNVPNVIIGFREASQTCEPAKNSSPRSSIYMQFKNQKAVFYMQLNITSLASFTSLINIYFIILKDVHAVLYSQKLVLFLFQPFYSLSYVAGISCQTCQNPSSSLSPPTRSGDRRRAPLTLQ